VLNHEKWSQKGGVCHLNAKMSLYVFSEPSGGGIFAKPHGPPCFDFPIKNRVFQLLMNFDTFLMIFIFWFCHFLCFSFSCFCHFLHFLHFIDFNTFSCFWWFWWKHVFLLIFAVFQVWEFQGKDKALFWPVFGPNVHSHGKHLVMVIS